MRPGERTRRVHIAHRFRRTRTLHGQLLAGCQETDEFSLYRASPGQPGERVYIASFNAPEPDPYNRENCELAAERANDNPMDVRFWCEAPK